MEADSAFLLITELAYEQVKDKGEITIYNNADFESIDLTIVNGSNKQVLKPRRAVVVPSEQLTDNL